MHAHFHFPEGNSSSNHRQPRVSAGRKKPSSESSISIETAVSGLTIGEQLVPDYTHWSYHGVSEWDINQNTPEVKFETVPKPSGVKITIRHDSPG